MPEPVVAEDVELGDELPEGFFPDYCLVRTPGIAGKQAKLDKVHQFEQNLTRSKIGAMKLANGLRLEERVETIQDKTTRTFILISVDDELLKAYAEVLRIRLPISREGTFRANKGAFGGKVRKI